MKAVNHEVDFYFDKAVQWQDETRKLRKIVLACNLTETLKWGVPCYTHNDRNIVLIHVFKEYCALLFFKGALLDDREGILIRQTQHVQAARQVRFTNVKEITSRASVIKQYIEQAIEVEKAGLKVELKKTREFSVPEEFEQILKKDPALKKAFETLTPGRQRGYLLHFSSAKQSKTRLARIEKNRKQILAGKGLNE